MQLNQQSDYALRAMVELSLEHGSGKLLSAKVISKREGVPLKFLEQILLTLKKTGFIHSKLGASGGYFMTKKPSEITFGQVMRLFQGSIAPIGCVDPDNPVDCSELSHCRFHKVMGRLRDAISEVVDKTTFADVCAD